MNIPIFRNNLLVVIVKPDSSSELAQRKHNEDSIKLNFTLENYVEFKLGDYISYDLNQSIYRMNKLPRVTENPKANKYEAIFENEIHELSKTKVFLTTPKIGGGNYQDYRFPLTGNAETFLQFICSNLNRNGINITPGIFKSTETKTVDFNEWNCLQAVQELSELLGFDWWIQGGVLNFDSRPELVSYVLQVGRNVGLREITRTRIESADFMTVLYGYGATTNLPPRFGEGDFQYDSQTLTENRLTFSGVNGESKLEKNVELYGRIEAVKEFPEIQPEFTGTIFQISDDLREFFDLSVPFNINDFLLPGIQPKITFLTGKLIGLTFNISWESETYKMTMDLYVDESGEYPNETLHQEPGDTYKLYDIGFPPEYLVEAETRLQTATQEWLDKYSEPWQVFDAQLDETFLRYRNIQLHIGDVLRIVSPAFGLDEIFEIIELTKSIENPFQCSIKFGDALPKNLLSLLRGIDFRTDQKIYNVSKSTVTNNQVTNILGGETSWE